MPDRPVAPLARPRSTLCTAARGVGVALLVLCAAGAEARAKEVKMKFATLAPEGTSWVTELNDLDRDLRERTGGSLSLKIYAGGVQGDERVVLRKMKAGQLHAAAFTGMGLGEILPWVRLLELPFQYQDYSELDHVRSKLDERLKKEFEARGYVLLAWYEVGTATLYSNRPLRTVEDVKGAKPWLWEGDPVAAAAFRAFGVNPTPLALPDVITSLQTGLIDTVYASPSACIGLQWFTKLKYRIDVPLGIGVAGMVVKKSFFDGLEDGQKKALVELGRVYQERLIAVSRKENEEGIKALKEKGKIETISWDPKEVEKNLVLGRKVSEELAGEGEGKLFPKAMLDEVLGLIDEARARKGKPEGK